MSGDLTPGLTPDVSLRATGTLDRMRVLVVDNYDSFTYNLVHLLEELGAEVVVRRSDAISVEDAHELASRSTRDLARPRPALRRRPLLRARPRSRTDDADARRLPRSPGDRRGLRRRGLAGAFADPRQGELDQPRRRAGSTQACRLASKPAATTRSPRRGFPTTSAVTAHTDDGEVMGVRHRHLPDRGRAVPPREHPHAPRSDDAAHVPRHPPTRARRISGTVAVTVEEQAPFVVLDSGDTIVGVGPGAESHFGPLVGSLLWDCFPGRSRCSSRTTTRRAERGSRWSSSSSTTDTSPASARFHAPRDGSSCTGRASRDSTH